MKKIPGILFLFIFIFDGFAEDGYETWLRYKKIENQNIRNVYSSHFKTIHVPEDHETIKLAEEELNRGLSGMLQYNLLKTNEPGNACIVLGTTKNNFVKELKINLAHLNKEGFWIKTEKKGANEFILIMANSEIGVLYGVFHFLRLLQTQQSIGKLDIQEQPKIRLRLLNHWDDLDGHVERGYAGQSLWRWHELPEVLSPRYKDYARYNASIGINGSVLTNVNANADVLRPDFLRKVKALADILRPYGMKVYLTARFNAPMELDSLNTADPLNKEVIKWWDTKVKEIYTYIPDFGGFLVKANSEGQPGPCEYGRTHAEGANLLARAVKPFQGVVMWRAFVYSNEVPDDRAKQAYTEFLPLDGKFDDNVLVQTKNGPIDFQPREPFHPLFGAMQNTPLMMEFQITQEYLGQGLHLCYLAPLFKECLDADTYSRGKGSSVSKVIDGSMHDNALTGIAGVSNIGADRNWTGHPIGQSNWYAFGRLAWDHAITSEQIADEWVKMTFGTDKEVLKTIMHILLMSREAQVNYTTPLGLHHQMAWHHHYGPGPWIKDKPRADWTSVYYHRADSFGIGFDRTIKGTQAVKQYFPEVREVFNSLDRCPENLLLWFHHVPWDYKMKSKRTLWEELCYHYDLGAMQVQEMQKKWDGLEGKMDQERFHHVQALLKIQLKSAQQWRGACVLYFQTHARKPLPKWFSQPEYTLKEYMKMEFKYMPGS